MAKPAPRPVPAPAKAAPAKAAAVPAKTAPKPAPGKPGVAVQTRQQASVSKTGATPEQLALFAQHAGAGLENASAQDYALPFIYLLQSNSPQVDSDDDKYVEGAAPGMFMNTVTKHLYGEEITVVPVDFDKVFNEWVPRDAGGGFVKSYHDRDTADMNVQEGNQIVDTANHYVLIDAQDEDDGHFDQAIMSMTSTKLAASRNWLSRISQVMIPGASGGKVVAPSFAKKYVITSEKKKNNKGTFYIPVVTPIEGEEGWVTMDLFEQATDFRAQLKAGQKGADFSKTVDDAEVVSTTEDDDEPAM